MKKSDIIEEFNKEKKAHQFRNSRIGALFSGTVADGPAPTSKEECRFGKWLYQNKEYFIKLIGPIFFQNLELHHERWHEEYRKIYSIFYKNGKRMKKINQMDLDKAKLYLTEINERSKELVDIIDLSLKRLNALNEKKF